MLELHRKIQIVKISIGLISAHIVMGIFQERITKRPYFNDKGAVSKFTMAFAYVAVQCFTNTIIGLVLKLVYRMQDKNDTPQKYFAISSIFLTLSPVLSVKALQWVSYPTQVIGKSSKPIVVMILGVLIARKSYRPQKYFFVVLIIIGVILFSLKPNKNSIDNENIILGNFLIGLSLLMDGGAGAVQDRMRADSRPSTINLMLYMNAWNSLFLIPPLIITKEGIDFVYFCFAHPKIIIDLTIVIIVSSIGQFFIAQMITNFGALPLSLVMTVRKFLTVLLSVIIFGNVLSTSQWTAVAIVFLSLLGDSIFQGKSLKASESKFEAISDEDDVAKLKVLVIDDSNITETVKVLGNDNASLSLEKKL